jgi:NitT/TauT family transport system substrate-binding protein
MQDKRKDVFTMNQLSKKIFVTIILVITLLITGCATNQTGNSDNTTKPTPEVSTDTNTAEQATTDSADQATTTDAAEKSIIKIAYLPLTHAIPVFETAELLAQKEDSTIQIELVKFGSWPELLDALNSGRVDGASVLIELAMKARSQGIGLKAVALGHRDGNAVIVANDINSVADLKGKKFAIPHRLSSHNILLNEMLTKNGMTIEDVEVVELPPAEMPSALAGGQISGYSVAEPFGAKAVALGIGKSLYQSSDLWEDSLCCGLIVREEFINNNPEVANAFATEYIEAGNQLTEATANDVAKKYLTVEQDVIDLSLQWISFKDLVITRESYDLLVEKMKNFAISDTTPSYDDFVYQIK